ncbi:MAG TPA: phage portal protein [Planctomycetota bacterium]|nr:phage portal protein [Planctomycetota bacterium]HRT95532.1 phage portal protein [Planctomycetota bacterium]
MSKAAATPNWLDRAIGWISPQRGLDRMAARYAAAAFHRGAGTDRPRKGWLTAGGSPDEDILGDLPALRARSRDLVANNPIARAIVHGINRYVVGSGLVPFPQMDNGVLGISDAEAEKLQDAAEALWDEWCPLADLEGHETFYGLTALADWAELESGEALLLRHQRPDGAGRVKTRWQVVEADRLAQPDGEKETGAFRSGIRTDADGVPVEYLIKKTHPGDTLDGVAKRGDYERVPARDEQGRPNVVHLYSRRTRPGQRRGLPLLAHCMTDLKDIGEYLEAELVGARVQACQALIVKGRKPATSARGATGSVDATTGSRIQTIEPGRIIYTDSDDDVVPFNPTRPSQLITPFAELLLKRIGASIGIPYEVLLLDFWRRSWSSARAALLSARIGCYLPRRSWLIRSFCQVAWEAMLEEAFLAGEWELPLERQSDFYKFKAAICRCTWVGPAFGWVDPEKELKAVELGMKLGLDTWQLAASELGHHWLDLAWQIKREQRIRRTLGLPTPGMQPGMAEAQGTPSGDRSDRTDPQEESRDAD